MRASRVATTLPVGATVYYGEDLVATKTNDDYWDWPYPTQRGPMTDRDVDHDLDGSECEQVIIDLGMPLKLIPVYDLEEGDYVVLNWGCWDDPECDLFDPNKSQMLFRVSGWLTNEPDRDGQWKIALDAPEGLLAMIGRAEWCGEESYDIEPITMYVSPDDQFAYVADPPKHMRWDTLWNWSGLYDFVDPPEEPS